MLAKRPLALGLVLALSWSGACRDRAGQPFCKLGEEHEIARSSAKELDGIELVALGRGLGLLALWSEQGGLFVRAVDEQGRAQGAPQRLGVRCQGGLAAEPDGDAVEVACLVHPERGKHEDAGGVLLQRVGPALALQRSRMFGRAGSLSSGIAMARGAHGLEVAWHDGSPDVQRVMWRALAQDGSDAEQVSQSGRLASAPSLAARAGSTAISWAETWLEGAELLSRIVYWDRHAPPRTLVPVLRLAASPQLFSLGDDMLLGFRDRRGSEKTGLYLTHVAERTRHVAPIRIGRADGVGNPALEPCMGGIVAATPRTYGGDYFVGVNWLDRELVRARGEQQFYEDAHAFTQVAAACLGSHALLLIAEFPQLQRKSMALRAVSYSCR
jgi:hypothetical protein